MKCFASSSGSKLDNTLSGLRSAIHVVRVTGFSSRLYPESVHGYEKVDLF